MLYLKTELFQNITPEQMAKNSVQVKRNNKICQNVITCTPISLLKQKISTKIERLMASPFMLRIMPFSGYSASAFRMNTKYLTLGEWCSFRPIKLVAMHLLKQTPLFQIAFLQSSCPNSRMAILDVHQHERTQTTIFDIQAFTLSQGVTIAFVMLSQNSQHSGNHLIQQDEHKKEHPEKKCNCSLFCPNRSSLCSYECMCHDSHHRHAAAHSKKKSTKAHKYVVPAALYCKSLQ